MDMNTFISARNRASQGEGWSLCPWPQIFREGVKLHFQREPLYRFADLISVLLPRSSTPSHFGMKVQFSFCKALERAAYRKIR